MEASVAGPACGIIIRNRLDITKPGTYIASHTHFHSRESSLSYSVKASLFLSCEGGRGKLGAVLIIDIYLF